MKFSCRALCVFFLLSCAAQAANDDDDSPLGDFAPLDDDLVLYIPKFAVRLGFRGLNGTTSEFGGKGFLASQHTIGDPAGTANRLYHDGYVAADTRTATDPAGASAPIITDGLTNNWAFISDTQVQTSDALVGLVAFHAYGATVTDTGPHSKDAPAQYGVEISLERDMGGLFRDRVRWGFISGLSINQVAVESRRDLAADVLTTTDYYSLNGRNAPTAPYTGPQSSGGVDTSVLITSEPVDRVFATTKTTSSFTTYSKIRGAYMTLRAGPTLFVPIIRRFSGTISVGAALAFVGTTLDVEQSFMPETGDEIANSMHDETSRLLPGFYVDASLQFAMTDTSGLYLGAVYQNNGTYTQEVTSADGKSTYTNRIDLSSLQGIRAGVSFKF